MKKAKLGKRKAPAKGKGSPKTVDEYFASIPQRSRDNLSKIRAAIQSVVPPKAVETISYGIPAVKHGRILVWYAAFSEHCSLFPTASVIAAFKDELKGYSTSKGTIQFPADKPVPTPLIKKLVRARLAQIKT